MSWSLVRSSPFSLERAESWLDTVSSWLVIANMPETVAHRMDRVEPSPAEMVWRAWGVRLGTRAGSRWRLSLVSVKTSARTARGGGKPLDCGWGCRFAYAGGGGPRHCLGKCLVTRGYGRNLRHRTGVGERSLSVVPEARRVQKK